MLSEYPDVFATEEVCEALRCGYNMLYSLLMKNAIKAYRIGSVWRIPKQAVIEYILSQAKLK